MWKIFFKYNDKSKLTLSGNQKEIPLELAVKYHREYGQHRGCKSTYQQYPKKSHKPISLLDKICELEEREFE